MKLFKVFQKKPPAVPAVTAPEEVKKQEDPPVKKIRTPRIVLLIKNRLERLFIKIDPRLRFVAGALILTALVLISTFFPFSFWWIVVLILTIASYLVTYFSILEGIEGVELFTLFILPVLATVALYFFYNLFPVRWLTRIPYVGIYAIVIYALLLTSNIFNVGVEKSLQLYRAAFSINYLFAQIILFLLYSTIFSLRQLFLVNGLVVFAVTVPVAIQFLWSVRLNLELEEDVRRYGVLIALVLAQVAILLSFVPFESLVSALILTALYYTLAGLAYSYIDQRLFKETIRGYIITFIAIVIIALLSLNW